MLVMIGGIACVGAALQDVAGDGGGVDARDLWCVRIRIRYYNFE